LPTHSREDGWRSKLGESAERLSDPRLLVHADRGYDQIDGLITPCERAENRQVSGIRNAVERGISRPKSFSVLRHGIRTRAPDPDRVVAETITVVTGLVILQQEWPGSTSTSPSALTLRGSAHPASARPQEPLQRRV
jgi:hypothetical protein